MNQPYPFKRESDWYAWGGAFAPAVVENAEALSISPERAADLLAAYETFAAAYRAATDPATRGRPSVQGKNDALREFRVRARGIVGTVQAARQVSDSTRVSLGIRVRKTTMTRRPAPTLAPVISASFAGATAVRFTARDATNSTRKAKPDGVKALVVGVHLGEHCPSNPREWPDHRLSGRTTLTLRWPGLSEASTVWITAWWLGHRCDAGPYAAPIRVRLSGTGIRPDPMIDPTSTARAA